MKPLLVLVFLASFPVMAQTKPKTAPVIPDALQTQFWKAQAIMQSDGAAAQAALQKATTSRQDFQTVLGELQKACGAGYRPGLDPKQNLICQEEVKPAPPAVKAPAKK